MPLPHRQPRTLPRETGNAFLSIPRKWTKKLRDVERRSPPAQMRGDLSLLLDRVGAEGDTKEGGKRGPIS